MVTPNSNYGLSKFCPLLQLHYPIFADYCSVLAPVANGNITYNTINQPLNSTLPNGTVATVTCNDGYSLEGTGIRVCIVGNWTSNASTCVESKCLVTVLIIINHNH